VKSQRTPDGSLFLQFPRGAQRGLRRALDQLETRQSRNVDAAPAVEQLTVGGQCEVVLGDDLVVVADVRHRDQVVGGHFPARLRTQITRPTNT